MIHKLAPPHETRRHITTLKWNNRRKARIERELAKEKDKIEKVKPCRAK